MLHSSTQEREQHATNVTQQRGTATNRGGNCQTIDIRTLAATAAQLESSNGSRTAKSRDPEIGYAAGSRTQPTPSAATTTATTRASSSNAARLNKMHSSEDPTAVVVNISGSKLRRVGSGSSGGGAVDSSRRVRKTSSTNSRDSERPRVNTETSRLQRQESEQQVIAEATSAATTVATTSRHHRRQHSTASSSDKPEKRRHHTPRAGNESSNPRSEQNSSYGNLPTSRSRRGHSQSRSSDGEQLKHRRRHSRRLSRNGSLGSDDSSNSSTASSCNGSCSSDDGDSSGTSSSGEPNLPYPGFPAVALKYLTQDTRPRKWCLMLITNPWFERISILVILFNCITLGMYQPCVDDACVTPRCKILQIFDDIIFAFFALEMTIKIVAMGLRGKNTYMADSWNRLDFFIVMAGCLEYMMHVENLNLTAIRTIRVLRPLRAINRIPSMRILVMLLLDTLPMLGNVLLLCFFVFFIFGIIGVQLWEGILRQRCRLELPDEDIRLPPKGLPDEYRIRVRVNSVSFYYEFSKEQDYICSKPEDSGMHLCADLPPYRVGAMICTESATPYIDNQPSNTSCVNWNQYYSVCAQVGLNPFQGTISFDNIGMAWVAIFLVISLEGWTDIMYYVQDAHSFWDWIYFVLLIVSMSNWKHQLRSRARKVKASQNATGGGPYLEALSAFEEHAIGCLGAMAIDGHPNLTILGHEIGSFFMINLCLVVIATQFSETKKREMERMRQERARYTSTSTLASSTNNSEPATCYAEIVKYIAHLWRRFKRRMLKKYRLYKYQKQQRKEGLLPNADNLTFSPSRIKCHHPKCPKFNKRKPSSIQDQMITVMVPLNSNNNVSSNNNYQHQQQQNQQQQQQPQQTQVRATTTTQTPATMAATIINGVGHTTTTTTLAPSGAGNHYALSAMPQHVQQQQQQQQQSSSENSEHSVDNAVTGVKRNSSLKNSVVNQLKPEADHKQQQPLQAPQQQKTILLKFPQTVDSEQLITHPCTSGFLSPPNSASRRPSVMFNEYVLLHTPPAISDPVTMAVEKSVCSSEKMTQAGDGSIWQVNLPQTIGTIANPYADCSELGIHDAMTCQELLAFSVAFSAALPTGQSTLESFYTSLARCDPHTSEALKNQQNLENTAVALQQQNQQNTAIEQRKKTTPTGNNGNGTSGGNGGNITGNYMEDYSCCYDLYQNALSPLDEKKQHRSRAMSTIINVYQCVNRVCSVARRYVKRLVDHKYFQQGILLAILINTLSMGIEYHDQPDELTAIVETSNVVFSAVFAVEMLLKVVSEGPFRYIANGFNVFDGIIVILSGIEICQQFIGNGHSGGGSGLSVLRTFRLLRILKLVRFMPNLRRQLFVMLRTMDNVAVFFSLLVLFIFIFSILGMNLFGCKFCEQINGDTICDRKNFDSLLWALVTVFQILTQEDWNVVLFNGMEKTSHWAALYFVALMTFGNYVLFNLLVAILVEGFSSERNERREREQRELVKKLREETLAENYSDVMYDESHSEAGSSSTNESYYEVRNRWHSAEDIRKLQQTAELIIDGKSNTQKQRLLQPSQDYQINEVMEQGGLSSGGGVGNRKSSEKDVSRITNDDDRKSLKKTYSIKDRRADAPRLAKIRPYREPPIITTTAATPQDSPNTTMEAGISFRDWNQQHLEVENTGQGPGSPSLLKPPTIFTGQRSLDEGIPSIDLIPPSPVLAHKPLNILNASQLGSNTSISNCNLVPSSSNLLPKSLSSSMHSVIIDDISKNSTANEHSGPIYVPTISSTAATLQPPPPAHVISDDNSSNELSPLTSGVTGNGNLINNGAAASSSEGVLQRIPSLKRFRRSSSKKKKSLSRANTEDEEHHQLNNGSDNSCLLGFERVQRSSEAFLCPGTPSMPPAKHKDTNRLSPQNSTRRLSTTLSIGSGPGSRRASACIFNSNLYQNLNQPPKLLPSGYGYAGGQRRMSSFELAFSKTSQLNLHNLEAHRKSMSYTNSKIDLDQWQKSYSNINEPDMLQQYIQERDKRKNSIGNYSQKKDHQQQHQQQLKDQHSIVPNGEHVSKLKILFERLKIGHFIEERESYALYIFPEDNRFRQVCTWFVNQKWFDNVVLLFIALNCITLAMERPNIPPYSTERLFLSTANYVFTVVFTVEMFVKVVAAGMFNGPDAYFTSGWNIMDGSLVTISIVDLLMSLISESSPRIFGILRVFRLLRSLRPLRVINRAPGLKLVVQTLLSSLRPIGNIVLICCTFFIIFGILGVQLFKGTFYYCEGENIKNVRNKNNCLDIPGNAWVNRKYNFDDLGKALMSLFVLSSRDGWVNIMYTGLDAVGVDQQPIVNYNEWRLLYFIAFILLVGFFVLNMFVGVVVENFHRCREEQEKEEKIRRAAKRALQMEKKRRRMHEPPYYTNYSPTRMFVHNVVTSKYFDLAIAAVIGLNVVTMAMEYYKMPVPLQYALKIFNYFFTAVFILEANMKLVALGWHLYLKDKWNQLDVGIVMLSIVGIVLEELETKIIPINPTIIRVMRVLRIARVLKLLKMAKGIRALLDTVMQALPQVGNLGLLFFLLFFIFAALGVELFGRLECSDEIPCQGLGEHAHFANFGMAFLTLFRVATGDNWNGIMKDTLRDNCDDAADCVRNCCVSSVIAPIFFVIFVLMAQFVLVNVVVAVLMKHLEESHKQMEDEMDMEVELERELVREQEFEQEQKLCEQLQQQTKPAPQQRQLCKVKSLPMNFTYSTPSLEKKFPSAVSSAPSGRRQTIQYFNQPNGISLAEMGGRLCTNDILPANFEHSLDAKLQMPPPGRRGRRSSTAFRKRGVLSKERSLDEQALRRRNLEANRMSCDSLPWGGAEATDYRRGTIFESLESDCGSPTSNYDIRSVRSEDVHRLPSCSDAHSIVSAVISEKPPPPATAPLPPPPAEPARRVYGRSLSTDQSCLGPPRSSLLSVPRAMPPRSRSGSSKQLFKQQALDEDPDMDESSLLLPVVIESAGDGKRPNGGEHKKSDGNGTLEIAEGLSKSDSAEILRIISERRRIDQRDNNGNEDSDYNQLLLVKSPQSSMD